MGLVTSSVVAHGWWQLGLQMGGLWLPIQRVVRLRLGSGWTLGGKVKATWARITGAVSGLDRGPAVVCRPCRSGPGAACRLSRAESERRCRAPGQPPGGALCHGRGRCDCGVCICHVSEPGVYFGPLCECHEWVCETYDGSTCAGKGAALVPPRGPAGCTRSRGFCHFLGRERWGQPL